MIRRLNETTMPIILCPIACNYLRTTPILTYKYISSHSLRGRINKTRRRRVHKEIT